MLAIVEIGNSNIVFALLEGDNVLLRRRIRSDRGRTVDEYGLQLATLLDGAGRNKRELNVVALASVVPALETALAEAVERHLGLPTCIITSATDMGIRNLCDPPESVGVDRLLNASAAYARFKGSCIVVDFGTATTISVITSEGQFLGGAIAPGLRTSADALTASAPRLAGVDFIAPESSIGTSTDEALRSGIVLGHAMMVDGLVNHMLADLQQSAAVVATGGLAKIVAPLTTSICNTDPDLTLHGIRLAYERTNPTVE